MGSEDERDLQPPLERVPYICDVRCRETIPLTAEEYERIRADDTTFAIVPGHSSSGDVVERHEHYVVVTKTGDGDAVARALDPREEEDA